MMNNQYRTIEKQRLKCLGDRYYVVSLPKAFIDNGILKLDKKYEFLSPRLHPLIIVDEMINELIDIFEHVNNKYYLLLNEGKNP